MKYRLGDICEIKAHESTLTKKQLEETKDGAYPVIGGGAEYKGYYTEYTHDGDLVTISSAGTPGIVKYHEGPIYADKVITIIPKNEIITIYPKYLYYILGTKYLEIKARISGTTIKNIYPKDLMDLKINIPPLPKQLLITEKVDLAYSMQPNLENDIELMNKMKKYYTELMFESLGGM